MRLPTKTFALCIDNTGYRASLIPGKVYPILPDPRAAGDELVASSTRAERHALPDPCLTQRCTGRESLCAHYCTLLIPQRSGGVQAENAQGGNKTCQDSHG